MRYASTLYSDVWEATRRLIYRCHHPACERIPPPGRGSSRSTLVRPRSHWSYTCWAWSGVLNTPRLSRSSPSCT